MPGVASAAELSRLAESRLAEDRRYQRIAIVCGGTGCSASGCRAVRERLEQELARDGIGV